MHPEDIKAAIRKKGTTLAELAANAEVSKQAISAALDRRSSERIDQLIADFIGLKPHQIWPSRYNDKGKRIRYRATPAASQVPA